MAANAKQRAKTVAMRVVFMGLCFRVMSNITTTLENIAPPFVVILSEACGVEGPPSIARSDDGGTSSQARQHDYIFLGMGGVVILSEACGVEGATSNGCVIDGGRPHSTTLRTGFG